MLRPNAVKAAIGLTLFALVIGFTNTFGYWESSVQKFGLTQATLLVSIPTFLYMALILLVWRQANWASLALLCLIFLSVPGYVSTLMGELVVVK